MFRIPIWNKSEGHKSPLRFCDAIVVDGKVLLEIKYGRNNYQQMPCEEIQKQIQEGIKEEERK